MKEQEIETCKQKISTEKEVLQELSDSLLRQKATQQAQPVEIEQKRQKIAIAEQDKERRGRSYADALREKQYKTDELSKGVEYYSRNLGLEFRRVGDNKLRFVFRQIDPADHNRKFSFVVEISEGSAYSVTEVKPEIQNLDRLLKELNKTNDFSRFIRQMRIEFKAIA